MADATLAIITNGLKSNGHTIGTTTESQTKLRFQLIPISESERPPVGEVIERQLCEGESIRLGRQVVRDGHPVSNGNRKENDGDIWFTSKVVSRVHSEMWVKDGQLYIKDIGSSSGTFLNKMRLSPSGKESRPYPLKQGDTVQFGVDYKGKTEDLYRSITMKLGFYDQSWVLEHRKKTNPVKFRTALASLLAATNPYARQGSDDVGENERLTDCCICIGAIAPFQALFISPCSHCYHYKCVRTLLGTSVMFQCPLCRQVANLTASVSSESLIEDDTSRKNSTPDGTNCVDRVSSLNLRSGSSEWLSEPMTPVAPPSRRQSYNATRLNEDDEMQQDMSHEGTSGGSLQDRSTLPNRSRARAATLDGSSISPSGPSQHPQPSSRVDSTLVVTTNTSASHDSKSKRKLSLTSKLNSFFSKTLTSDQKKEKVVATEPIQDTEEPNVQQIYTVASTSRTPGSEPRHPSQMEVGNTTPLLNMKSSQEHVVI